MKLRKAIRDSRSGPLKVLKDVRRAVTRVSVPAPPAVWRPIWRGVSAARTVRHRLWSGLVVTPLFHGACREIGDDFVAGIHLPFVVGDGDIHLGDGVTVYGKVDFTFGASGEDRPSLHVGHHCVIGHASSFSVSGHMRIGDRCLLAPNVSISDCNGHPIDPKLRRAGLAPETRDVRDVTIGDNVWIGAGVRILPGTTIGDDCVIGAGARVSGDIPAGHLVVPPEPDLREIQVRPRREAPSPPSRPAVTGTEG